ncbi:MAG: fatty acid desaturase CarF family protein [Patescibacteria group bacterium]
MAKHHNSFIGILSVFAFAFMIVVLARELTALALPWTIAIFAGLLGYVLADFVSGFVHFLGDTFGSERTFLIGKTFIYPFREHHTDQLAITRHNFFVTNKNNCLVSLPAMLLMHMYLFTYAQTSFAFAFIFATLFFLVLSIFATNQIHKWAHMKKPPRFVRLLQKMHLILNPKHHAVHHAAPHTKYFCITTGWLNPIIEKLYLFKGMRKVFKKM